MKRLVPAFLLAAATPALAAADITLNVPMAFPESRTGTAYVLEAKLNYQRDPALKGKDPAPFKAYAVPLK